MKTAVEYIELRLLGIASFDSEELRLRYKDIIKQAKEKEKEQIKNVFEHCWNHAKWNGEYDIKDMEDYLKNYNQNK